MRPCPALTNDLPGQGTGCPRFRPAEPRNVRQPEWGKTNRAGRFQNFGIGRRENPCIVPDPQRAWGNPGRFVVDAFGAAPLDLLKTESYAHSRCGNRGPWLPREGWQTARSCGCREAHRAAGASVPAAFKSQKSPPLAGEDPFSRFNWRV